jgi:ribosome-interacting GTPase 1
MPANLPPQYFDVEKKYRDAKDLNEKLVYLQQMLSIIPKHKGTEKLQAELKTKMSKLKDTITKQKKSKGGGGTWFQVEKQGAGQIVLVGLPSSGKSSILNTLTNAHVDVGDYPFTTQLPQVGMMQYENVKVQIVDTPPLYDEAPPWLFGLYRNGDVLAIILDGTRDPEKDLKSIIKQLNERNVFIRTMEFGDVKKTITIISKCEAARKEKVDEFISAHAEETIITFSMRDMKTHDQLKKHLFDQLGVIRVYTKKVGAPIVRDEPVILKHGATVLDAAEHIHKDFKRNLKFARLWNETGYSGQRVEKHHVLIDEDVLEFHV